jgi:hypothetical protein
MKTTKNHKSFRRFVGLLNNIFGHLFTYSFCQVSVYLKEQG